MSLKEATGVWKNYLQNKRFRISLGEVVPSLEGFWVEMREFKSLTLGEANLLTVKPVTEGDTTAVKQSLSKLIVSWNLTDMETNDPLAIPSQDILVLDKIPVEILTMLMTKAGEREGVTLPNEIKTSSGVQ